MRLRRLLVLFVATVCSLVLVGGFGYFAWAKPHMDKMSAGNPLPRFACTSCHLRSVSPHNFAKGIAYPSPAAMALAPDGRRLYVTCEDTEEIAVLGPEEGKLLRKFPLKGRPHGVAMSPDGSRLFVSLRGEDRLVAVEISSGKEVASVPVGKRPCGLGLTPDGKTLVVANVGSDDVSLVDVPSMSERTRLSAGREPYSVAITRDGRKAFVSNRLSNIHHFRDVPNAELTVIDLETPRVARRHLLHSSHQSEGVAATSADGIALVSFVHIRNLVPIMQVSQGWVMTSGLGVISPGDGAVRQFPLDEVNAYFADPSGVVIDEAKGRAYVASGGGDCVSVVDLKRLEELASEEEGDGPGRWADHLGISSEYVLGRIPTGPNPRALLLSPEGDRLFVAEHLNDSIAVVDTETLQVSKRISLEGPSKRGKVRRGEVIFHRAAITFQGQFACRSCHPDGHVDGLTYDFSINGLGKNLLDNRSLLGIRETAPFKWNGKNKDLFEQCGPRFSMVLTMADPFPPDDLSDLVAYIESLPPPNPPVAADAELTEAQVRGKAIFERGAQKDGKEIPLEHRCATCHRPPLFTNRLPSSVVTQAPTDASDDFDTPHLIGIGLSAPYLHDGRALTLEEIWTVHSPDDTHGVVNDLNKAELNDLVEFLKVL